MCVLYCLCAVGDDVYVKLFHVQVCNRSFLYNLYRKAKLIAPEVTASCCSQGDMQCTNTNTQALFYTNIGATLHRHNAFPSPLIFAFAFLLCLTKIVFFRKCQNKYSYTMKTQTHTHTNLPSYVVMVYLIARVFIFPSNH